MTRLLDFAWQRPSPVAIQHDGYGGVLRYLSVDLSKAISVAEARGYHAARIPFGLVYEDGAQDALGGADAGTAHARIAAPQLAELTRAGLWEPGRPVYFAVDFQIAQRDYPMAWECVSTFARALGRPAAPYGPRPFLSYAAGHGCRWHWETGASSWNGTGPEPPGLRIRQGGGTVCGGASCDTDDALVSDWGQFPAPSSPKPAPIGDDVTLHSITVHCASNGQGDTATSIPTSKVAAVTAVFGLGPNPAGTVGYIDHGGHALITAKGWAPGAVVTVTVAEVA